MFPRKELVDSIKARYPKGTRVELVSLNDPYSLMGPGERGTVAFVDDLGTVFCDWDCGSNLGVVLGEDIIKIFEE